MRLRYWGCSRKRLPMPSEVSRCYAWEKSVLYRYIAWSQNLALQGSGGGKYLVRCPMYRRLHASYSTSRYCCPLGQAAERATLYSFDRGFPPSEICNAGAPSAGDSQISTYAKSTMRQPYIVGVRNYAAQCPQALIYDASSSGLSILLKKGGSIRCYIVDRERR